MKKIRIEDVTLEMVKISEFGCKHCLYNGCECLNNERFKAAVTFDGTDATCDAYCYYD